MKKVGTKESPADIFTKGLKRKLLMDHTKNVGGYTTDVRAGSALLIGATPFQRFVGDQQRPALDPKARQVEGVLFHAHESGRWA